MQVATAAHPWKRIGLLIFSLALALACVLLYPPLATPMAFLLPLVVCPAQFSLGLWYSLLLSLVPCAGALLTGGDLPLSLLLLPCPYLCLLATQWSSRRKLPFFWVAAMLSGIVLLTQTLWLARVMLLLGGDLFTALAKQTVGYLSALPNSGNLLYSLVQVGFLKIPEQFQHAIGFPLGGLIILNPALRWELLNALRFQLYDLLKAGIPSLLVQSSLIIGLFTGLRAAKEIGKQTAVPVAVQPGGEAETPGQLIYPLFRVLRLPNTDRRYLVFLALAALGLGLVEGEIPALMSSLMMAAFATVCRLLGASALVFFLCRRRPGRSLSAGLLTGALYLILPTLLLMLGLADQFMDLRTATFHHHEED